MMQTRYKRMTIYAIERKFGINYYIKCNYSTEFSLTYSTVNMKRKISENRKVIKRVNTKLSFFYSPTKYIYIHLMLIVIIKYNRVTNPQLNFH